MTQTIIRIGNSEGVILPKGVRKAMGVKKGSRVDVEVTHDKKVIISKTGSKNSSSLITPEFIEILAGINRRYGPALKKLAKL